MAATSETASRITSIFDDSDYVASGWFTVNLWSAGTRYSITTDDSLPVSAYAKPVNL